MVESSTKKDLSKISEKALSIITQACEQNGSNIVPDFQIYEDLSSAIDHDSFIGDGVHIAPGVNVAGNVNIGNKSFIGIGASIIQGIRVGENVTVGAGSAVLNNLKSFFLFQNLTH